ncbi:Zn-dependent exopeptidase [Russula earlei]|uniref:Zn-dependent exopeptidase n=1 Tax=Russula earlei TaxID=71964 RepID=A0ACC0UHU3_9AGAM|nr:Zn-dependent exopeptidase [Russula earlei]
MIIAKLIGTVSLLVVYPHSHPHIISSECLSKNYIGTYGSQDLFIPSESCLSSFASTADVPSVHVHPDAELVWVEQAALEQHLLTDQPFTLSSLQNYLTALPDTNPTAYVSYTDDQQHLLGPVDRRILYQTSTSALLTLSSAHTRELSLILPPTWRIYVLPSEPSPFLPVPEPALARVRDILSSLRFNPDVAKIVSNISLPQVRNDIRFLTGEDGRSGIESRHTFSSGARIAAEWLKVRFEETGANCEFQHFLSGFAPNIICRYPSIENATDTVLVSAHYDSRGSFGSTRAPGGNDDGSGTVGLLAIARTIQRLGIKFRSSVEFVAFAGEEQGLLGSQHYAREMRRAERNLTLMVQADMIAYHEPGEPPQLGLPEIIGTPEVTQLVANISTMYAPELTVGFTPVCCSDHQSFHFQGFPATQVFERAGLIADPMYHNSGDISERIGYDLEQVRSIAKVQQFATLLHAAGFHLS